MTSGEKSVSRRHIVSWEGNAGMETSLAYNTSVIEILEQIVASREQQIGHLVR